MKLRSTGRMLKTAMISYLLLFVLVGNGFLGHFAFQSPVVQNIGQRVREVLVPDFQVRLVPKIKFSNYQIKIDWSPGRKRYFFSNPIDGLRKGIAKILQGDFLKPLDFSRSDAIRIKVADIIKTLFTVAPNIYLDSGIYGQDESVAVIEISTTITHQMSLEIIKRLQKAENDPTIKEIRFYIYSPGGSARATLDICDAMERNSKPITTINLGRASSGAVYILSCGDKGRRYMTPSSRLMIHLVGTTISRPSRRSAIEGIAERVGDLDDLLFQLLARNTGKTIEQLVIDLDGEDTWMSVWEAIEYGLVDHIYRGENDLIRNNDL